MNAYWEIRKESAAGCLVHRPWWASTRVDAKRGIGIRGKCNPGPHMHAEESSTGDGGCDGYPGEPPTR